MLCILQVLVYTSSVVITKFYCIGICRLLYWMMMGTQAPPPGARRGPDRGAGMGEGGDRVLRNPEQPFLGLYCA